MRRLPAVAVALALVAGGCGDDGGPGDVEVDVGDPTVVTRAGDAVPGGPVPTTGVVPGTAATAPPPGRPPAPAATAPGPTTEAGGPALDAGGPPGSFAASYLRPDRSERLVVEVHADVPPAPGTVEHLVAELAEVTAKPVAVATAAPPGAGARAWTAADLTAAADAGAATAQGGGVAVLRLLFVAGTFEGDGSVLGVAVRGDVAAVFTDRVRAAGGLLGAGARSVERAVATHEAGHLLGLVDLFLDTGRADPEHPGHSRNPGSVMHWAVESSLVGELLGASPPTTFDADDRADLAAIARG